MGKPVRAHGSIDQREPIRLADLALTPATREEVVGWIFARLADGRGTWVLTPNLELLQQGAQDPAIRALYSRADLRVADGMPLLWLARVRGRPFPDRVAGSDLVLLLAERAAREGRSIFLLGGDPGVGDRAAGELRRLFPGLRIVGAASPRIASPPQREEVAELRRELEAAQPDLVYVAFGSPKTEHLIDGLREALPGAVFLGCGISLSFLSGDVRRAPDWMQRLGLEWLHRMGQEPKRLTGRYLGRNLPFFCRLLGEAWAARQRGPRSAPAGDDPGCRS